MALSVLQTYNCRNDSGVIKRGEILDDWKRYGVYYGSPEYLRIHDFSSWNILVFDWKVLGQGVDPADYAPANVYIYIAFGSRFASAAQTGGYYPPDKNDAELLILREAVHREIDQIMDAGYAGVFWDECDTGFWTWDYDLESSDILKTQLQEYCNYVRSRGGRSFINGCPYFAECGEEFMLESFLSTWWHNLVNPDFFQNNFFNKYTHNLEDSGEAGGIPWSAGIFPWLYVNMYAPQVDMFAHSYGNPLSEWHHDKQEFSLAGSLAIGLKSYNFIEPTNQTLIHLHAHDFYVGAPLECPQIDCVDKTASRKYTGANVLMVEDSGSGTIDMNVNPDYWWDINHSFEDINWEVDGHQVSGANTTTGSIPDYLQINGIDFFDDRLEVYFRLTMQEVFEEAEIIPIFFYIGLDNSRNGWNIGKATTEEMPSICADLGALPLPAQEVPYLYFHDMKAQVYMYGRSLFYWDQDTASSSGGEDLNNWRYLYPIRYQNKHQDNYIYYAIRKETLSHAVPTWDKTNIRIIPSFGYGAGTSFFTNNNNASAPSCLPPEGLIYDPHIDHYAYMGEGGYEYPYHPEEEQPIPFPDCPYPDIGSAEELEYNQMQYNVRGHVPDISKMHEVICTYSFTLYGYGLCQTTLQDTVYSPHSAVIYSEPGQINNRVSSITIAGNFDKAWVFDRENGQFVGPDNTPDTYFTTSPFSPNKTIDAQDIAVAIAHDNVSPTNDSWSVVTVDATLVSWSGAHDPGYDIALPDLIEWQSVYDVWKGETALAEIEQTYLPTGITRGGVSLKKGDVKGTFTVTVPSTGEIADLLDTYDITNATLLMRRTYDDLDHDNSANTDLLVWAYVDSWELTDIELRIRAKLNFHNWGAQFPKRRLSYFCPFVFRGPQCTYGGAALTCDKTLTTCQSLGNDSNFGGIPTLPRLKRGRW